MRFKSKARRRKVRSRGFTLIEMLVVMFVIMIILAIAVPNYSHSVLLAKEAKLHQNLATLNKVIQEYSLDKKQAPQSLVGSGPRIHQVHPRRHHRQNRYLEDGPGRLRRCVGSEPDRHQERAQRLR